MGNLKVADSILDAVEEWRRNARRDRRRSIAERGLATASPKFGERHELRGDGLKYAVPDEREVEILQKTRAWRAKGLTSNEIRELCIEEGILTRRGEIPSVNAILKWVKGVHLPPKAAKRLKATSSSGKGRKPGSRGPRTEDRNAPLRALLKGYINQGLTQAEMTRRLARGGVVNSKGNPYNRQQVQRFVSRMIKDGDRDDG